jgi:group I intron endonuclease
MIEYGHVYQITNTVNGKNYFGQAITNDETGNDWHYRCKTELRYPHNPHYERAIKKYGMQSFVSSSFAMAYNQEELNELEQYAIAEFKSYLPEHGYNKRMGGENGGKLSQETRDKIGAAHKGKTLSTEHRSFLSELARNRTPEHRAKIGAAHKGKKRTDEARAKMSAANKGKKRTDEARKNMSVAQKGRPKTEAYKAKRLKPYPSFIHRTTGEVIPAGIGLKIMCESRDLNSNHMNSVAHGKRPHHKGWTLNVCIHTQQKGCP